MKTFTQGWRKGLKSPHPSHRLKDVMEQWEQLLEDHDQVVYIPMSSGLSGSCQTALMLAEDYEGRVQVVNNQRISVTQRPVCPGRQGFGRAGMER